MTGAVLSDLDGATTAVLTMELQRGIVGDLAVMRELAAAARPTFGNVAALCAAVRAGGGLVVHNTMTFRPGGEGFTTNSRIQKAGLRLNLGVLTIGEPGAAVVDEIEPADADIEVSRHTGMTPFTGTALAHVLSARGIRTVVATGVSLNIGVLGLVLSAADLGFEVVVPRDAVVAVPEEFGEQVLAHTVGLLATVCRTADVLAALA